MNYFKDKPTKSEEQRENWKKSETPMCLGEEELFCTENKGIVFIHTDINKTKTCQDAETATSFLNNYKSNYDTNSSKTEAV
jgi:hypothetical protein